MTVAGSSTASAQVDDPAAGLRVAVTGANGFIGRAVCSLLAKRGYRVRALVRRETLISGATEYAHVSGLDDVPGLTAALTGVDAVVHLAALVHDTAASASLENYRRTNVEGTRRLFDAAAGAGARAFVFASSVKAVGERSEKPWTDDVTPAPADPYGVSKLEAEHVVRTAADRCGMHAPILRLPLVYGPGVKANMRQLFTAVWRGVPLPFAGVHNLRSIIYVGNVAAAVEHALRSPGTGRGTFFVSDGAPVSITDLITLIGVALQRPAKLFFVPAPILRGAGRLGDFVSRFADVPISAATVDRLLGSLVVDDTEFRRITGFVPPFSLEQGLAATAADFVHT